MVINTNNAAQRATNNLNDSQEALGKSLSRLSSGQRIVNPSDDAAGLAVSSRLAAQISRLQATHDNVANATAFTQSQDGYLKSVDAALIRMGELAMLAKDPTKSPNDRSLYDQEFQQLKSFIRETTSRNQNGIPLFDGAEWNVTQDSEGNIFKITKPDLSAQIYSDAISGSTTWKTTIDLWKVTQDGHVANVDLWKDGSGDWHTSDPGGGGVKYVAGSYIKNEPIIPAKSPAVDLDINNNGVSEVSGNNHTVTVSGGSFSSGSDGAAGSAIEFDGVNDFQNTDYIRVDDSGALPRGSDDFSISLKINFNSIDAISDKVLFATSQLDQCSLSVSRANKGLMFFSGGNNIIAPTSLSWNMGQWYDIAVTKVGNDYTIYRDGVVTGSANSSQTNGSSLANNDFTFGRRSDNAHPIHGKLDEIKIFKTGISATDITHLNANENLNYDGLSKSIATDGLVAEDPTATGNNEDPGATKIPAGSVISDDPTAIDPSASVLSAGTHLTDLASAGTAMGLVQAASQQAALDRAGLGASYSRMQAVDSQISETLQNLTLAMSRITDVDVAEEATAFARHKILVQSGTQMLTEANKLPKIALELLEGLRH
jgi:flagellin-like hook-associated protein FlgL